METLAKGRFPSQAGQRGSSARYSEQRDAGRLKCTSCLCLDPPVSYFQTVVDPGQPKVKLWMKGDHCTN